MKRVIFPLLLLVIAGIGNWLFFASSRDVAKIDLASILPKKLGQWQGKDLKLRNYVYKILGSKNVISRQYSNGENVIFFTIVVSDKDRRVVHPPEVCLKGGGEKVISKFVKEIEGLKVNQLILAGNPRNTIVWYWYGLGDEFTTNYYYCQLRLLLWRALGKETRSYLFRVVFQEGDEDVAKDFIEQFLRSVSGRL